MRQLFGWNDHVFREIKPQESKGGEGGEGQQMSRTATFEMIDGGGGSGDHHQSRRIHHGCWFMVACRDTGRQIPTKSASINFLKY